MRGDWTFEVNEISADVYRVTGRDGFGRRVERTGFDPEELLEQCKLDAAELSETPGESSDYEPGLVGTVVAIGVSAPDAYGFFEASGKPTRPLLGRIVCYDVRGEYEAPFGDQSDSALLVWEHPVEFQGRTWARTIATPRHVGVPLSNLRSGHPVVAYLRPAAHQDAAKLAPVNEDGAFLIATLRPVV